MIMETPVTTNEKSFSGLFPPGRIYFTIKYYCIMYFCIHLYYLFFTKKQIEKEATPPTLGISRGYALTSYVQQIPSQIAEIHCLCSVGDYVYAISRSNPPKIYSLADNTWQQGKANSNSFEHEGLDTAAAVMNSKLLLCMGFMNVLMIFTS